MFDRSTREIVWPPTSLSYVKINSCFACVEGASSPPQVRNVCKPGMRIVSSPVRGYGGGEAGSWKVVPDTRDIWGVRVSGHAIHPETGESERFVDYINTFFKLKAECGSYTRRVHSLEDDDRYYWLVWRLTLCDTTTPLLPQLRSDTREEWRLRFRTSIFTEIYPLEVYTDIGDEAWQMESPLPSRAQDGRTEIT